MPFSRIVGRVAEIALYHPGRVVRAHDLNNSEQPGAARQEGVDTIAPLATRSAHHGCWDVKVAVMRMLEENEDSECSERAADEEGSTERKAI